MDSYGEGISYVNDIINESQTLLWSLLDLQHSLQLRC